MRPATATSADGPFNLYQAICLACHGESYNRGVLALFSNTIYSGRDIEKVNNFKIDAFDQRSLGCLGYMQDQEVYFYTQTSKIHTVKSRFNKRIDSIKSVAIAFITVVRMLKSYMILQVVMKGLLLRDQEVEIIAKHG